MEGTITFKYWEGGKRVEFQRRRRLRKWGRKGRERN